MTAPSALLPPSSILDVALRALLGQGRYGVVTGLAEEHGLRREQVYALRDQARLALGSVFGGEDVGPDPYLSLDVFEADIRRTVVALRTVTPASVRDIVAVLPILYGEAGAWSYGKVWNVLHEADQRAAAFLAKVNLSGVQAVALDELFSQGRPVFAGIDLDTQYLFQLEVHEQRTGQEWAASLSTLRDEQKLRPTQVVKDAGSGLAKGVRGCWPSAEEIDDLFHAVRELGKVAWHLEQRAYGAIAKEEEERERMERIMKFEIDQKLRRGAAQRLRRARERSDEAIDRYDSFEKLRREALVLLQLCDRGAGRLRQAHEVEEGLVRIAEEMLALTGKRVRKVARYLRNRAPGLGRYLRRLGQRMEEQTEAAGGPEVRDAAIRLFQATLDVHRGGPQWDRAARKQELRVATRALVDCTEACPVRMRRAVSTVFPLLVDRHRASSAIENLNSVLRPYLVVQKHAEQGFLDLFRFYWNTRKREWGRWKGTSAYQQLTGEKVDDWLSLIGFEPGPGMAAA